MEFCSLGSPLNYQQAFILVFERCLSKFNLLSIWMPNKVTEDSVVKKVRELKLRSAQKLHQL